jgi:hypothetical protein
MQPAQSKNNMQKFLGELNYLRRFIFDLLGKISAFVAILRLKNEADFAWRAELQLAFDDVKSTCLRRR